MESKYEGDLLTGRSEIINPKTSTKLVAPEHRTQSIQLIERAVQE